jgi:NAD(P)H-quinone oxidoreductase subunit 2
MNLGAFAAVILFGLRTGTDQIKDYGGLFTKDPFLAVCISVFLLSLGGIPPFAGFFGKLYLFWAGWQSGFYLLVLVGLVTSVISIYYYLRVIKIMFIQEPSSCLQNYYSTGYFFNPIELGMTFCFVGSLFSGIFFNPIVQMAQSTFFLTPSFQESITQFNFLNF